MLFICFKVIWLNYVYIGGRCSLGWGGFFINDDEWLSYERLLIFIDDDEWFICVKLLSIINDDLWFWYEGLLIIVDDDEWFNG